MQKLRIYKEGRLERELELGDRDLRIGRGAENEIHLEDPTKAVSRFHAELRVENGQYVLLDLNSQNGTWVGGQRVQRAVLEPGMQVTVGGYTLEYPAVAATAEFASGGSLADTAVPGTPSPAAIETQRLVVDEPRVAPPVHAPAVASPPPDPKRREGINPISLLARPVVLLSAFGLVFLVLMAAVLLGPEDDAGETPAAAPAADTTPPAPAAPRTNEEMVAAYLAEAQALFEKGEYEKAIGDNLDRLLVIDRNNAAALALKAKAEEALRQAPVETAAAETPAAPEPAAPEPAAAAPAAAPPAPVRRAVDPAVQRRNAELQRRYTEAVQSFNDGEYTLAIAGFEGLMREEPGYRDAADYVAKSRDAVREQAMKAYTDAASAQQREDWTTAIALYTRAISTAAQIDEVIKGAAEARAKAQAHVKALGEDALRRARQFDAVGRSREAIELYEQVVELLPPGDPSRKVAADRLTALRTGRQ